MVVCVVGVCAVGGLRVGVGGLRDWRFAQLAVCVVGGLSDWRFARFAFGSLRLAVCVWRFEFGVWRFAFGGLRFAVCGWWFPVDDWHFAICS